VATLTGQVIGRYRILDRVGQGGMATVYKAYDPVEERHVAIKVLSSLAADSPHFTARFEREAKVVAGLRHPNIVPVWDYGEDEGKHYLVMPLLEVGSLADRLMSGPLKPRESGRIVTQVCDALDYAHQSGVIHRDIKPSNILLDQDGNALVSDFGLVYIENASVSLTGSALIGTPAYMSPEQARGEKVTPATDQYAFGVVLYELATGQLPFDGETPMAVAIKHITDPIPFPREQNANVPLAVEHVILKATAKDPQDRFESMAKLGEAYEAALDFALDPRSHAMPKIDVPVSVIASHASDIRAEASEQPRRRRTLYAALIMAILLLLMFIPARAFGLLPFLDGGSGSAEGTNLTVADLSSPQLTAMAGTLEVMSTQLAEAQGTRLSPEDMQTAVVGSFLSTQESGDSVPVFLVDAKKSPTPTVMVVDPTQTTGPSSTTPPTATQPPGPTAVPSNTPHPSATSHNPPTSLPPTVTSPPPSTVAPTTPAPPVATTPAPPTKTPTETSPPTSPPTDTQVPTLTFTPVPETQTLDEVPCSALWLDGGDVSGLKVWWSLGNDGGSSVKITSITINWPILNQRLDQVTLDGDSIWNGHDSLPPTKINSGWASGSREVPGGSSKDLMFIFHKDARPSGYAVSVILSNGCVVSADR
jgi:serine/threonine protein kinase